MWLDSHCHLVAGEFDVDRAATLDRACEAGVDTFIAIGSGYGIAGNARAVELAAADPRVFATVGVHPHEAKEFDDEARALLEELIGRPRVVAVGECGLDYHYMNSDREVQRAVFAEQAATARSRRMPATIHVRGDEPNAFEELLDIWQTETRGESRRRPPLLHGNPRVRAARDRGRLLHLFLGHPHVQERSRTQRGREGAPARTPDGRNRRAAARPRGFSRQAQRARPRQPWSERCSRRSTKCPPKRSRTRPAKTRERSFASVTPKR